MAAVDTSMCECAFEISSLLELPNISGRLSGERSLGIAQQLNATELNATFKTKCRFFFNSSRLKIVLYSADVKWDV